MVETYCFDFLNETFDLPTLAMEIAERIKNKAKYGTHTCELSKITYLGTIFTFEFRTSENEYITQKFRIDNPYSEQQLQDTFAGLGMHKALPYSDSRAVQNICDEVVKTGGKFVIYFGRDEMGIEVVNVIGKAV